MSEPNVYNGGMASGDRAQATGVGGHIYNHAPPAPSGRVIAIRDADLEAIMMQLAKLQAALRLSKSENAEQIGNEVAALSQEVGKSKHVDESRASSLLSTIKGGAEVTKSIAEAAGALGELFGLA
jgi:hypothetical protein